MPDLTDALRQLAEIRPSWILSHDHSRLDFDRIEGASGLWYDLPPTSAQKGLLHLWLLALARADDVDLVMYTRVVPIEGGEERQYAWMTPAFATGHSINPFNNDNDKLYVEGDAEEGVRFHWHADPNVGLTLALVEALRTD